MQLYQKVILIFMLSVILMLINISVKATRVAETIKKIEKRVRMISYSYLPAGMSSAKGDTVYLDDGMIVFDEDYEE